jgi:hypothetical protein
MTSLRRASTTEIHSFDPAPTNWKLCPRSNNKEKAMKTSTLSILTAPLLAAGLIALSGCGKSSTPTKISYREIGICKSYQTPSSTQQAKADEGFAIFKIDSIDNSTNGSPFYLHPERFYVNQSTPEDKGNIYRQDRRFTNVDSKIGAALGVKYVPDSTIAKSEKIDDVGFFLIPLGTNNPSRGPEADQYNFTVAYDTGTGDRGTFDSVSEGIMFAKTNAPNTKYPIVEDCKELALK